MAAALTREANDLQQLEPMLGAVDQTLRAANIQDRPGMLLADSGYGSIANLTSIPDAPELLIWPATTGRTGKPRKDGKPSQSRKRRPPRRDVHQAHQRGGQGLLGHPQADRRAGLRQLKD